MEYSKPSDDDYKGNNKSSESSGQGGNKKGKYDLEDRTLVFAKKVRQFTKSLPRSTENIEDIKQLTRASGSVGANYIEANESLSKKDFLMRIKICRKEAKESRYFLRFVDTNQKAVLAKEGEWLVNEVTELMKIFGAIVSKS